MPPTTLSAFHRKRVAGGWKNQERRRKVNALPTEGGGGGEAGGGVGGGGVGEVDLSFPSSPPSVTPTNEKKKMKYSQPSI